MMPIRRILALALLPLTACALPPQSGPALADTEWLFEKIDGTAPVSDKAKLTFHADSLGASVGCNGMGGDWRLEGSRLIAGPLIQTQMYCEGPVWDQERAVSVLLSSSPTITRTADRLVIRNGGHSAELRKVK